jgi:hypothetical protein
MIDDNLAQVPSRVLSKSGRSRVAARVAELRRFLARLRSESGDLKNL